MSHRGTGAPQPVGDPGTGWTAEQASATPPPLAATSRSPGADIGDRRGGQRGARAAAQIGSAHQSCPSVRPEGRFKSGTQTHPEHARPTDTKRALLEPLPGSGPDRATSARHAGKGPRGDGERGQGPREPWPDGAAHCRAVSPGAPMQTCLPRDACAKQ